MGGWKEYEAWSLGWGKGRKKSSEWVAGIFILQDTGDLFQTDTTVQNRTFHHSQKIHKNLKINKLHTWYKN